MKSFWLRNECHYFYPSLFLHSTIHHHTISSLHFKTQLISCFFRKIPALPFSPLEAAFLVAKERLILATRAW